MLRRRMSLLNSAGQVILSATVLREWGQAPTHPILRHFFGPSFAEVSMSEPVPDWSETETRAGNASAAVRSPSTPSGGGMYTSFAAW